MCYVNLGANTIATAEFKACGNSGNINGMSHDSTERPHFLWDEALTREELKELLNGESDETRLYYAAKILREARFEEAWEYLSPAFIGSNWDKLRWRLGRKKGFWEFIYSTWHTHGLIP